MADGDAPSSSAAQPLSSTGELALPGSGTVTSSGRRYDALLLRVGLSAPDLSAGRHDRRTAEICMRKPQRLADVSLTVCMS